jgi:FlaA1/EpsC-like NDP-sugar epimerase
VAFSDGSLLHGFNQRIQKKQPIVAPNDIKRYFVTPQESGELCLMSCLLGENRDIFFPKLSENLHLITFAEIAKKYLKELDYEAFECKTEDEAREFIKTLPIEKKWPCLFSKSDTTGEKDFEEFYVDGEVLDLNRFPNLGIVKSNLSFDDIQLDNFISNINSIKKSLTWNKFDLLNEFKKLLSSFDHKETGKYLDSKM